MSLRETNEYKSMSTYQAVAFAEGFEEAESEEQVLAAWQFIHDKGLTASLQGFFGRTVAALIDGGHIEA